MPRLIGPPDHCERREHTDTAVPSHVASCLTPEGRWIAMIGGDHDVTMYDLEVVSPPRREAWRHHDHTPIELVMAGTPDHGLLAVVDVYYRHVCEPRAGQQPHAQLTWRALPGARPLELPLDDELPEGWFSLVDRLHAPIAFREPVIVLSTGNGGLVVRRDGDQLIATTASTHGRLLTAHPDTGLVVSTAFGVRIERPDGEVVTLPHDRPATGERFVFAEDGRRATWLRDGLLTALELDETHGWETVDTQDVDPDREVLDLGHGALLWRRHSDASLHVSRWAHGLADEHVTHLADDVDVLDLAGLSASGAVVRTLELADGRLRIRDPHTGADLLDLAPINVFLPSHDPECRPPMTWAFGHQAPDHRYGIVSATLDVNCVRDDVTRTMSSLTLWDLELMRPLRTVMPPTLVREREGDTLWAPDGTLAVVHENHIAFWRLDGDELRHIRDAPVTEITTAPLVARWLTADTLAVTSAHDERALLFDTRGHRRLPDHFGPWGFQVPDVGRFSATGRRTQSTHAPGYRTAVAGTDGLVMLELLLSTWPGSEPGAATTMVATRDGNAGAELAAIELPVATRWLSFVPHGLHCGRYALVRDDRRRFDWHAIRVDEQPLRLTHIGRLEGISSVAVSRKLPWLLHCAGEARDRIEVRHIDDLTTVVAEFEVPPGASHVSVSDDGDHLDVHYADRRTLRWKLDLD